ncbi:MAG: hypothetical protein ACRBBQ_17760 [Cognatishimia sp.]
MSNEPENDAGNIFAKSLSLRPIGIETSITLRNLFAHTVTFIALIIGWSTAYTLGIVLRLPWSIASLINHSSIVHLTSQLTLFAFLFWALFKISFLPLHALIGFFNFLYCHYYLGIRRPHGLRDPVISRVFGRRTKAIVEGRWGKWALIVLRCFLVAAFFYLAFFRTEVDVVSVDQQRVNITNWVFMFGVFGFVCTMAAYNVAGRQSHFDFFGTVVGRQTLLLASLFFCTYLGMMRVTTMLMGPTMAYSTDYGVCHLAPMMPVYGGKMYFDRETLNFLVFSADSHIFAIPYPPSLLSPKCLPVP